jgi:hypothetical protein
MEIYFNGCRVEPTHLYSDIDQLALTVMHFHVAVTILSCYVSWGGILGSSLLLSWFELPMLGPFV